MIRLLLQRVSLLALALSLIVPMSWAQAQQQQQPAEQADISDQEIEKVAELFIEISDVKKEYQKRLRNADNPDNARSVQQEMKSKINQTIEEYEGLSSKRYDRIVQAAQTNDSLKKKILARVEKVREDRQKSEG